mgnify:CR=1 FL=1
MKSEIVKKGNWVILPFLLKFLLVIIFTILFSLHSILLASESESKWHEKISINGDTRLRWEGIYKDPGEDNERERFRFRLGMSTNITKNIKLAFRFETGVNDPVSSNKTFGEGFSIKEFGIGRAYLDWAVSEKINILAGKTKRPWFVSGANSLLWDNDFNPEGIFVNYKSNNFFLNGGHMILDQGFSNDETILYSFQIGKQIDFQDRSFLIFGLGLYDYQNAKGKFPFYKAKGNTINDNGNYEFNYQLNEFFMEYNTHFLSVPVIFHTEIINNSAIRNDNKAFSLGIGFGSVKKRGDMQFNYSYYDTDKDALIGSYSDSDFAGGNTDSKGYVIRTRFGLNESMALSGVFIISEYNNLLREKIEYNRVQIDLEFRF